MSKFFKIIKTITLTILLCSVVFIYMRFNANPMTIKPFPYIIKNQTIVGVEEVQRSNILIIGDRMAVNISRFIPTLQRLLSKNLESPIKISNWAGQNEGLHRTIQKLKKLKKFPSLVIYHGGTQERYEKKFEIKDHKRIKQNFKLFQNEAISTMIMSLPQLSRLIYHPVSYVKLNRLTKDTSEHKDSLRMKSNIISYEIYGHEIEQLIELVKDNNSTLLLTTTPVNLEQKPNTCSNSNTWSIQEQMDQIDSLLSKGSDKEALIKSRKLMEAVVSNAEVLFQYAIILKRVGKIAEAKRTFQMAKAFDCDNDNPNPIYNSIVKQKAIDSDVDLVDFQKIIYKDFIKETLFLDKIYPQNIYYQRFVIQLSKLIKSIMKL